MEKNKLKLITIILLILLTTMVSFWGVYGQKQNRMENEVKDYKYAIDLEGARVVSLSLDTSTKQVIKDSEGNVIDSATDEEIEQKGYKKEETAINDENKLTVENYNAVKDILNERFKKLNVKNYNIKVNDETGEIIVEIPENDKTDDIVGYLTEVGKFEIIDSETKEVLLDNSHIQTSSVLRSNTNSGVAIYISIEFNGEGKKKLEEISKTYVKTENTAENTENTENAENTSATTEKKITMKLDDTDIISTSFDEPLTDGKMYLNVGQATTDKEQLNQYLDQARSMVAILSDKSMPLTYKQTGNIYVASTDNEDITNIIVIAVAILCVIALVIFMARFKLKGLLATCSYVGAAALLLLIIRYTNVELSTEGVIGIFTVLILNFIAVNKILSKLRDTEDVKKAEPKQIINMAIKDIAIKIVPLFIMAIIFTFISWIPTSSFGMVMFYGLIIIVLYNLLITKNLLKYEDKK